MMVIKRVCGVNNMIHKIKLLCLISLLLFLTACEVSTDTALHTPVEVCDGFYMDDDEFYIRYRDGIFETVKDSLYTAYECEGDIPQLLPVSEREYLNREYDFSNLTLDFENNVIISHIKDDTYTTHIRKSVEVFAPKYHDYWNQFNTWKHLYETSYIFPDLDGECIAIDDGYLYIRQPTESIEIKQFDYSIEPLDYFQYLQYASTLKIKLNEYIRENNILSYELAFADAQHNIYLLVNGEFIKVEG